MTKSTCFNRFLNNDRWLVETMSLGNEFHALITRTAKKCFLQFTRDVWIKSFNESPRVIWSLSTQKKFSDCEVTRSWTKHMAKSAWSRRSSKRSIPFREWGLSRFIAKIVEYIQSFYSQFALRKGRRWRENRSFELFTMNIGQLKRCDLYKCARK